MAQLRYSEDRDAALIDYGDMATESSRATSGLGHNAHG
jgi:hypothetical protein